MSEKLLQVFRSSDENFLVGIPKVFDKKDLKFRTEASRKWWKAYLKTHRQLWYKYIDFNKIYCNANFTRNYIAVENKATCSEYFNKIKKIWENRCITIIEGEFSRVGVGNDLFSNAKSIQRIIAPSENAFDKYNDILKAACNINRNQLILIALGPTATVLAYDLFKSGYQAIDIGHIDIEYEWFTQKVLVKVPIKNKYTFEASHRIDENESELENKYINEIIERVI